jgi:hypothetical protein
LSSVAVATWLSIKQKLRRRMPADEWKLWVLPARLLYVAPANPLWVSRGDRDTLVIALPRSGRAIYKAPAAARRWCGQCAAPPASIIFLPSRRTITT